MSILGFGKKKEEINEVRKEETAEVIEVENIEEALMDIELQTEKEAFKEYIKLSEELSFNPTQLREEAFKLYLSEKGIKVYNYAKVELFLNNMYGGMIGRGNGSIDKKGWVWVKLLNDDISVGSPNIGFAYGGEDINVSGRIARGSYNKIVPYHILELVRDIKKEFSMYTPYVSTVVENLPKPDPFLMYTFGSANEISGRYVIAHWNEPAFK